MRTRVKAEMKKRKVMCQEIKQSIEQDWEKT